MHKYTHNRPSRSSRSIGVSYITVTRKHSSRRLCTQLGRATLDLMFKSRITNMRPIREFLCYKVGSPTSELNSYAVVCPTCMCYLLCSLLNSIPVCCIIELVLHNLNSSSFHVGIDKGRDGYLIAPHSCLPGKPLNHKWT